MKRAGLYIIIFLLFGVIAYLYILLDNSDNDVERYRNANKTLLKQNDSLVLLEKDNALKVVMLINKVDSLLLSDSIQKKQLKNISWKYENLKNTYDNATDVVKDSIFTTLINQ